MTPWRRIQIHLTMSPMKYFILLSLMTSSLYAAECKLTGVLASEQKIETSFVTASVEECQKLALSTKDNNFYGLVEKEDKLMETRLNFKEEEPQKEIVNFEESSDEFAL